MRDELTNNCELVEISQRTTEEVIGLNSNTCWQRGYYGKKSREQDSLLH